MIQCLCLWTLAQCASVIRGQRRQLFTYVHNQLLSYPRDFRYDRTEHETFRAPCQGLLSTLCAIDKIRPCFIRFYSRE
ncbi:hypothetical protein L211DRAFT_521445 [Terfezia boudieri ATCC MYA-4762]|uniref:Secreted protein n=1 Tax=Terfezia boudieri ATCC MYA-4762 TaxID=1051890 RepID=A0A3N4LC82_9PEZI|nr:hypothetical protein L211DRAFT_521445 [Terfezia boudieri ATCC MYA-4762]